MTWRLPYYFLVDAGASASKDNEEACRNLIMSIVCAMRANPFHLESAHLTVIRFGSETKVVIPLTDLCSFTPGPSIFESGCGLGYGISLLVERVLADQAITTPEFRGCYRPIIVLLLISEPSDDFVVGLEALDAIKTTGNFAFVSRAVSIAKCNRLKDSGFSVITEDSSSDESRRWHDGIISCLFAHMEDPITTSEDEGPGDAPAAI
jgi:uncharacterized protein YegL